jgi:hypothetical protein
MSSQIKEGRMGDPRRRRQEKCTRRRVGEAAAAVGRGGGTRDRVRRRDRLKGHPQERQHSALSIKSGGKEKLREKRDRVPPARSTNPFAQGIVTEWPRPASRLRDLRGSGSAARRE